MTEKKSDIKVYLVTPSARDWKPKFGASLTGLVHRIQGMGINGHFVSHMGMNAMAGASLLSRARQKGLDEALAGEFTHYVMLDDDMAFPADILDGMFARDLGVVTTNCCLKRKGATDGTAMGFDGQYVGSIGKTGIEEVAWAGFAVALINLDAIRHVPKPHYEVLWLPERGDYLGEDLYFCAKIREHGVKIHIDHDASHKVTHVGDYDYGFAG